MAEALSASLPSEAAAVAESARELRDSAASLAARAAAEEQSLRQRAKAIESDIRRLSAAAAKGTADEKVQEDLERAKAMMGDDDVAPLLPSKGNGRFLKMFLGPVNVRAASKEEKFKVKEEYNKYRDKTAYLFLFFPSVLLGLRYWVWNGCFPAPPVQLYQAWLLFLYTSFALRENILRRNGSDILPWWIYHHYLAMLMALISLTWEIKGEPDCANKQKGVQYFLMWAILQGFAMLLQNTYQRQRLHTRIALGKANRMDVVGGESAGVKGQLLLLYPVLFVLQGFEAFVGVLLLRTALHGVISEWQVVAAGILLVVMAVGNFVSTVQTMITKLRVKKKMKKSKSKSDITQGLDAKKSS